MVCLLEVAEADDVAVGLDRVEDAVGARVRLDQAVRAQVLVDPQRVERRGVEAGQEHVDDDDEVELAVLQPQRQVLVVVLELVGRGVEARAEHGVVVLDRVLEEVARACVESARSRSSSSSRQPSVDVLVGGVGVDEADLQPLRPAAARSCWLANSAVVALGRVDRGGREQRVEAREPLARRACRLTLRLVFWSKCSRM